MIVIGSSCQVQPAAGLVHVANMHGAELYECNLQQAISPHFFEMYHFYKGKASGMVPLMSKDVLNFLRK
jgi:NAD-dependent SIR2 family protein deacetylase